MASAAAAWCLRSLIFLKRARRFWPSSPGPCRRCPLRRPFDNPLGKRPEREQEQQGKPGQRHQAIGHEWQARATHAAHPAHAPDQALAGARLAQNAGPLKRGITRRPDAGRRSKCYLKVQVATIFRPRNEMQVGTILCLCCPIIRVRRELYSKASRHRRILAITWPPHRAATGPLSRPDGSRSDRTRSSPERLRQCTGRARPSAPRCQRQPSLRRRW